MSRKFTVRFQRLPDGRIFEIEGRPAQTLAALSEAGHAGVTALEISSWALRLAHYIFLLKRLDLDIVTDLEPHEGSRHARYRLLTPVRILETKTAEAA